MHAEAFAASVFLHTALAFALPFTHLLAAFLHAALAFGHAFLHVAFALHVVHLHPFAHLDLVHDFAHAALAFGHAFLHAAFLHFVHLQPLAHFALVHDFTHLALGHAFADFTHAVSFSLQDDLKHSQPVSNTTAHTAINNFFIRSPYC